MKLQKGVWCGYQNEWNTANAKLTYDKLLHSSTNIENPGIGLDTKSGIIASLNHCILSCNNSPRSVHSSRDRGVASLIQPSVYTGEWNYVYIYHNQQRIVETELYTYSEVKNVVSTGGRELITRAERGDTLHLGTEGMGNGFFSDIITCFEFLSV